jgi:lysophospholipase L1-like esterase
MLRNLLLAAASLVFALLLMEGALRLRYEPPPTWIEPQTKHLRSPLLGWVLPPGSRSYTIDAPVAVNSIGLRDDEIARPKPNGETRVLVLGDSFTFALGVRFEDLYPQQLERRLRAAHAPRRFQVVNAGIAGYNTRQELIYLIADGLALEPDLLVVGFYWNDLVGNEEPLPDPASTPRVAPDAQLYEGGERAEAKRIPKPIRDLLRQSLLLYLSVQAVGIVRDLASPPTHAYAIVQEALLRGDEATLAPYWEATARRLHEIAEVARAHRLPAVLLLFPMENQLKRSYPDLVWAERLREIWAPTGFPLVDLEPAYRREREAGRNPFLPYDLHPNAHGMEIAAAALHDEILRQGYLGLERADRAD